MDTNIVIGTAGHIDHGKTTLIKALSGIETDTTVEEKERGISINLGFAYIDLPSGRKCGVVDVPGHEKFIKNMIAGVSGINLVLLLVDSREGIMPQTREHIDILTLLGIENYIIVMTKIDLVDEEFRELVKEDIAEFIKGTPLENSPIIEVDSISKKGIDNLLQEIDKKTNDIQRVNESKNARINVDRSFQIKGFGTVITGTLTEGTINIGDELEIYPSELKTKVRNIQVHEKDVKTAYAGQRTAINLNNVKVDEVGRGSTLATPDTLTKTYMLDTEIRIVRDSKIGLKLWDRVRIYAGTSEVMGRVVPLGLETIEAGQTGFAQIRLEEEIAVKNFDKFIIRTYSPMITIGGGVILDANPKKHRRFKDEILEKLKVKLQGNNEDLISNYILTSSSYIVSENEILKDLEKNIEEIKEDLEKLIENKTLYKTALGYFHTKKYEDIEEKVVKIIGDYHSKFKLKTGISKAELISKIKGNQKETGVILELLEKNEILKVKNNFISLKDFEIKYDEKQLQEKKRIEKTLSESKFTPPSIKELVKNKIGEEVLSSLIGNTVVKLDDNIVFDIKVFENAKNKVIEHINKNKKITLAEFRDITGSSRKYAMAILEYLDKIGVTKREEDYRVLK